MKASIPSTLLPSLLAIAGMACATATATTLEDWQFNEEAGTKFSGLTNTTGSAVWAGDVANVATDGAGNLVFSVSVDNPETPEDESASDIFRNSNLTVQGQTTGQYELSFTYTAATLAGGDATGANVGFTIRNSSNEDLFNVRLQRQNDGLRLQRRDGNTNTDLERFESTTLTGPLAVRVVFDLDEDTYTVYWTPSGQEQRCQTNIPMLTPGLSMDVARMYGSTDAVDWGATDEVSVDFLTLSTYTAPATPPAIEDWQFNVDEQSLGTAQNDAGTANLGGNADNAQTSGGNMVFTQGVDDGDNIFRNGVLSTPNRTEGRFEMEWFVPSATLEGGDETGANMGFGMRDEGGTDLFVVRLQRQNSTIRLQARVGTNTTNLVDFGVTSITNLKVSVVADLDTDTFDVHWQLGDEAGSCASGLAMSAVGLEFDQVRTVANTNTVDWGPTDQVSVDYLVIREFGAATEMELSIVQGPGAGEITLIWPTTTPASTILEESADLGAVDTWAEVTEEPVINGDNYELTLATDDGGVSFFRLNNP